MCFIPSHTNLKFDTKMKAVRMQDQSQTQPDANEIGDMARRANQVVKLLEVLRGMDANTTSPTGDLTTPTTGPGVNGVSTPTTTTDDRPPKRPWEDIDGSSDVKTPPSPPSTTAEQDMDIIRSKRAQTAASYIRPNGALVPAPKSKYRKRVVSTFFHVFVNYLFFYSCFTFLLLFLFYFLKLTHMARRTTASQYQINALHVVLPIRQSGGADQKAREPFVMRVDCVSLTLNLHDR